MKPAALDVFVCPLCRGRLEADAAAIDGIEIVEGTLSCTACRGQYPVRRGVPRFVPEDAYAASFGSQWNWFPTIQLDSANGTNRSELALRATTGWRDEEFRDRRLLDAGVGAGRFAERAAAKGAQVFGIDLTTAIDAAYRNIGGLRNVHLAQADIFSLPFRPETFDLAYSIGVLHHTPNPPLAFARLAQTVVPDGRLAIYLYARYGSAHRFSDVMRAVTTRLPLGLMWAISGAAVPVYYLYKLPFIGRVIRLVLPTSLERDWRWRWLDTFDWYTPTYQWKYLYPEVFRWFSDSGFEVVDLPDGPIRVCGRKTAARALTDGKHPYRRQLVAS